MTGIFHPKWTTHHRTAANSGALARVLIERITTAGEYNLETGLVEGEVKESVYLGSAQMQKVAFPTNRDFVQDAAKFQRVQFTLGFSTNELQPLVYNTRVNDRITLLKNPADPDKEGNVYYVHGNETSSNAWQQVLTAQTNMKQG